jgi:MFS family permease
MKQGRLFLASCIALIATAMAFSIRADIIPAMKGDFGFTDTQMGQIIGPGLWGFTITIVLGGILLDLIGMGRLMAFAFFAHLSGVFLTIFSQGYWTLYMATLLIGLANGTVEAVTNPLVATLYPKAKIKHLNILHAWWPGGLVIGGLLGFGLTKFLGLDDPNVSAATVSLGWKIKMGLILVPTLIYGFLFFGQKFPQTERVTSGVSYKTMWKEAARPLFLVFLLMMALTAMTELGPDQWVGNLLQNLVGIQGVLLLAYSAGIMFVLRQFFGGFLTEKLSPLGLLTFSSILSCIGLYMISGSQTALYVLIGATIFGLGKAFFWPTMIGVVAELFPKGGALLICLMGGMGMFAAGWIAAPVMGKIQDYYAINYLSEETRSAVVTDGGLDERKVLSNENPALRGEVESAKHHSAMMTYRTVAYLPAFLAFAFLGLFLYYRRRGGYRAENLASQH